MAIRRQDSAWWARHRPPLLILRFAQPLHTSALSTVTVQIHQESDYRQATIGRFRVGFSKGTYSWANNPKPPKSDAGPKTDASAVAKTAEKDKNPTASAEPAAKEEAEKAKKDNDDEESADEDFLRTVGLPRKLARALEKPEAKRSKEQVALVRDYFEYTAPELTPARLEIAKQEMNLSFLQGAVPEVMVTKPHRRARREFFRAEIGWTIRATSCSRQYRNFSDI